MNIPSQRPVPPRTDDDSPCTVELSLEAMLKDDIVRMTMKSDGVSESDVRALGQIVPLLAREAA